MIIKKLSKFLKNKILIDYIYNIVGFAIYIFFQQIIIFPFIGKSLLGANELGVYLALLAIINIFSSAFGSSLGDVRVLSENEDDNSIGFQFLILTLNFIFIIIILLISYLYFRLSLFDSVLITFWGIFSVYRNYILSEYVKFKQFKYVLIIMILYSVGSLLGLLVYIYLIKSFAVIFLSAELISIIFYGTHSIFFKEKIVKQKLSKNNSKVFLGLSLSTFCNYLTNSIDKFIIPIILGPAVLATYYSIAISSKLLGMLSNPLSRVIFGWSRYLSSEITIKKIKKINISLFLLFIIIFLLSVIMTPMIVHILYPAYSAYLSTFLLIVSFNGAIRVIADLIQPIFIRLVGTKILTYINFAKLVLYLSLGLLFTKFFGIMGFAYFMGILEFLTNLFKIITIYLDVKGREIHDFK